VAGPFDLNLRHVEAMLAVADCGSLSAASHAVNLSQPALTQALAKLELAIGGRIFDRDASGMRLTEGGTLFVRRIRRGLDALGAGVRRVCQAARLKPIAHVERRAAMGHLHALAAVEKAGSYALAARGIGLSQPSVHRAVKELEAVIGVPLLERAARSMRPTSAGRRLVVAVRLMAAELQAGLDELAALRNQNTATLRIGALPLPRSGLLPEALSRFTRAYPQITVIIIEGPYEELLAALIGAEIDLMVGALRDPAPTPDIVQRPLFADELFVVGRRGHPLGASGDAPHEALARFPWVIGARGAPMRTRWETLFERLPPPPMRIECSSILVARGLLLEGDWLALMSRDQFRLEQQAGLLAAIGGPVPGSLRQIGVTTRRGWLPTGAQKDCIAALATAAEARSSAS
jgi:molybdate transport repressor ModE-like protein